MFASVSRALCCLIVSAVAASPALSQSELTLSVVASPASFTAAGQTITLGYRPVGALPSSVTVVDSRLGTFACAGAGGRPRAVILRPSASPDEGLATTFSRPDPSLRVSCTRTYVTTADDVRAGSITFSAFARGTVTVVPSPGIARPLPPPVTIASVAVTTTVTLDAAAVRMATRNAIRGFLARRADRLVSTGPDATRLQSRVAAVVLTGRGLDGLRAGLGVPAARDALATGRPRLDVWLDGAVSGYSHDLADGRRRGHFESLRGGADYVVAPGLVAGVMIQHDRSDESGPGGERGGDGRGWMAGPYAGLRLSPNLMLDVRLLAGRSRNQIDPLGAYTDTFETTRWLAAARLSGMWRAGAWSFRPSAELAWLQERQAAYVSVPGIGIDAQSIALGRVTAGPEIAYAIRLQPALTLEPFAGIKALYDFAHPDVATVGGLPVQHDALRGRVEAGATLRSDGGFTFQATASWDGLGDDRMRAWQGRAAVVLPLQ